MPYIVKGAQGERRDISDLRDKDLGYEYPQGMDLRPGSPLHNLIVDQVCARANASHSVLSSRFDSWNKMDEIMTAYTPVSEDEAAVQNQDSRKPISVIFPYTYAIKETLVTYGMTSMVQDPIFRYEGTGPEDTIGAMLMEKKIHMDCMKAKVPLALHTQIGDGIQYGFGISTPGWFERRGTLYSGRTEGKVSLLGRILGRRSEAQLVDHNALLYEGNKLENIDPYCALPDPSVSIHKVQDGDFFGWIHSTTRTSLLELEALDEDVFNARYTGFLKDSLRSVLTNESGRKSNTTGSAELDSDVQQHCDIVYMYVKLIPKEWDLGDSEYPEKWMFGVVADSLVIMAKPLGLNHGLYPVSVMAPDFDGYQMAPMSRLEMLYGLQHVVNWLFNSHIANVRKSINDLLVIDPWMINMNDLKDPGPGGIIRTRRPMWGKGIKEGIFQLNIQDITKNNINDTAVIVQWMNHIAGVDDSTMGTLRSGGPDRLTGQEFQGTRQSAVGRLMRMSKIMSLMGMQDIAYMFACHTQQLMSQSTYIKTTGDWEKTLRDQFGKVDNGHVKVDPLQMQVDFDIIARDGSMPGQQSVGSWLTLYKMLVENPDSARDFNMFNMFKHIATEMGAKNIEDFAKRGAEVTVAPDEDVMRQVEKGNLKAVT